MRKEQERTINGSEPFSMKLPQDVAKDVLNLARAKRQSRSALVLAWICAGIEAMEKEQARKLLGV